MQRTGPWPVADPERSAPASAVRHNLRGRTADDPHDPRGERRGNIAAEIPIRPKTLTLSLEAATYALVEL